MNKDTKSLIKATIMGLFTGGTMSALYSLATNKADEKPDNEFGNNDIVVPLSRKNFMKAVRPKAKKQKEDTPAVSPQDVASMSARDLDSLKRTLLRKGAECDKSESGSCKEKIKVEMPSSEEMTIHSVDGVNTAVLRDDKGRFVSSEKTAGILGDAGHTILDMGGAAVGVSAGIAAVKLINDRIALNRKRKQVEESRLRYADMLAKEVDDYDSPYYTKHASDDRGLTGKVIGLVGATGLAASTIAGIVTYRILEKRRQELEREKDKDLAKYPYDKTIKFTFPKSNSAGGSDFFA